MATFVDVLRAGGVHFGVGGRTKEEAITNALATIRLPAEVDRQQVLAGILRRERSQSTGFGKGFALPHYKQRGTLPGPPVAGLCYLSQPVDWDAVDARPVTLVLLLITGTANANTDHLRLLEPLWKVFGAPAVYRQLEQARSEDEVLELMERHMGEGSTSMPATAPVAAARDHRFAAQVTLGQSGLHVGPAGRLLESIRGLRVRLTIRVLSNTVLVGGQWVPTAGGQAIQVDGSNPDLASLMRISLSPGAQLRLECDGTDAALAMDRLRAALADPGVFEGTSFNPIA